MKRRGFTLIELLAVIVILAILALITVPIILKLVNNARKDSSVRSAENYLDGVKKAMMNDTINSEIEVDECTVKSDGNLSCNGDVQLTVDVDGKKPTSGKVAFSNGTISDVTDLRFGKFYISGEMNSLVASTKETEGERPEGVYLVGDKISYKGERYYVIEKSDDSKDYIVLLKMWPLSKTEIENNGMDENNMNRINVLSGDYCYRAGTAGDRNGYGIINWTSSTNCYQGGAYNNCDQYGNCNWNDYSDISGCPTSYDGSDIKVIVDNWAKNALDADDLKRVDGYKVRLLSIKDALGGLRYSEEASGYSSTSIYFQSSKTPRWAKGTDYNTWMMDIDEDRKASVLMMDWGGISSRNMWHVNSWDGGTVRPVINLKKEVLQTNTQQPTNP